MDKAIRNALRLLVTQARKILEESIQEQLQGVFGIHPDGKIESATAMHHLSEEDQFYREQILIHLHHIQVAGSKIKEAEEQLVREVSFTHLNRLCAYKMMEKRKIIGETVSRGLKSRDFIFYVADHPEEELLHSSGRQDVVYRHFLEWRGMELSSEIGVLFSPNDPANRLFPPPRVLDEVLAIINSEELKDIWSEDETIGWVYQYFTPKELRDQVRNESQAPRNSYELAFRNQFYTPSYVVHFLTDNTLGRMWYEMRQGKTRLKEQCTYMVRRPDEVFMAEAPDFELEVRQAQLWLQGEVVPEPKDGYLAHTVNAYERVGDFGKGANDWVEEHLPHVTPEHVAEFNTQELLDLLFLFHCNNRLGKGIVDSLGNEINIIRTELRRRVQTSQGKNRTQEEMLRSPFFIPYRKAKDPRSIKILDPACGSGHFLLYCFGLLETIYLEAYETALQSEPIKHDFATLADLRHALPGLILTHNLYGIDIDLRATQIASLALWLRAQRSYQTSDLARSERPRIMRSNIVCAEPMPGEQDLLEEFTATLQPRILGKLVQTVFDKMHLASEVGSLFKIEVEVKEAILEAKQLWRRRPKAEQLALWLGAENIVQQELIDEAEITDIAFWSEAEARVVEALRTYAVSVANGKGLERKLFADDAVQGLAFIDICQKLFDVVLMNPPFGEASKPSKAYIDTAYPRTKNDIYAAFVERWLSNLVPRGMLGAITSRTGFFLTSFQKWREEVLLKEAKPTIFADLGEGVLDTAMVETAAYCLTRKTHNTDDSPGLFLRLLNCSSIEKPSSLMRILEKYEPEKVFIVSPAEFAIIPGSPICYWITSSVKSIFSKLGVLESDGRENRVGLQTSDNFRFLHGWWEVPSHYIHQRWFPYAKGGGYSPYYRNTHLCVDWDNSGAEIKAYARSLGNSPSRSVRSEDHYFRPGLTYSDRCSGGFATSPLAKGCIFDVKGSSIFVSNDNEKQLLITFGVTLSEPFRRLLTLRSGTYSLAQSFQVGQISSTPFPIINDEYGNKLQMLACQAHDLKRTLAKFNEIAHVFFLPALILYRESKGTLIDIDDNVAYSVSIINDHLWEVQKEIDEIAWKLYGLSEEDRQSLIVDDFQVLGDTAVYTDLDSEDDSSAEMDLSDTSLPAREKRIKDFIQWVIGICFARWDIRLALDITLMPKLQRAFDSLPACPPGMLISPDGLPATSGNIVSEEWLHVRPNAIALPEEGNVKQPTISDSDYPIRINWDGILIDDQEHEDDIVRRMHAAFAVIWRERAEAIEQEVCQILGVKELREYFRRSGSNGFWLEHIQRYSKSRRKAPIYWLLQSSKKNYAIWLYYHRLNKDSLFKVLQTVVKPKLRREEIVLEQLRTQLACVGNAGREAKLLERQLEKQESFLSELEDFRDKLRRAADLNLEPDLNDGVVLNAAPLREVMPWSEPKRYWQELLAGKYEWSSIGKQLRAKGLV